MVRFKNRYLLVDLHELPGEYCNSEKALVRFVKSQAEEMMGELFIAKISYSLQVKYLALEMTIIRVPREHCQALVACLFPTRGLKIISISGTIRKIQGKIYQRIRKELHREATEQERREIDQIDYS